MISWSLIFWNALYAAINADAAAYCLIATGLNVHVGYTGLLNFGQAAFAAVGAYAFAIPIANYGWHWYFAEVDRGRAGIELRQNLLFRQQSGCILRVVCGN